MTSTSTDISQNASTYDAVPYHVGAFRQSDPDRLAVLARLFGLASAPPQAARILELGCASGGNLIPMATLYPQSQFIGVDLSQRQVNDGQAVIRELKLPNIQLLHRSITDVAPSLGTFDYILAHGVYCWVPPAVQNKILEIFRDNLAPAGVAYISYNTFPGWHSLCVIRDMICYHTRSVASPLERVRQSRNYLAFLGSVAAADTSPYGPLLAYELALLAKKPDTYLLHEYLEDFNQPLYFHEFAARAQEKKLQYLAETEIATMLPNRFGPEMESHLLDMSADLIELEQNMDFVCNRTFRQTLLCHAGVSLDRVLRPDAITGFHIASQLKADSATPDIASDKPEDFSAPSRPKITIGSPILKAALLRLAQSWPLPIAFPALLEDARERLVAASSQPLPSAAQHAGELRLGLLNACTSGVAEFTVAPPAFTLAVSERPVTSPYVRFRARRGREATNLRLDNISLSDASRVVLVHLDGSHDRQALIALIASQLEKTASRGDSPERSQDPVQRATEYVDYILPHLAADAWLIG